MPGENARPAPKGEKGKNLNKYKPKIFVLPIRSIFLVFNGRIDLHEYHIIRN